MGKPGEKTGMLGLGKIDKKCAQKRFRSVFEQGKKRSSDIEASEISIGQRMRDTTFAKTVADRKLTSLKH